MIIYQPLIEHDYECLNCCDYRDYEIFNMFDGSPRLETWRPIRVNSGPADEGQKGLPSDFPWLVSHVLVMRKQAILALRDILDTHGELLPLVTDDDAELFAFNARTVDALDETRSSIVRFPDSNRVMDIEQVAFVDSKIRGLDIFRLPYRAMPTYVSEYFVNRVNDAKLVGLEFEKVWSS